MVAAGHAARRPVLDRQGERARCCFASSLCRRCGAGDSTSSAIARSSATRSGQGQSPPRQSHPCCDARRCAPTPASSTTSLQKGTLKIYTRQEAIDRNVAESERQRPSAWSSNRSTPIAASRSSRPSRRSGAPWSAASMRRRTSTATATSSRSDCASIAQSELGVTFHFNTEIRPHRSHRRPYRLRRHQRGQRHRRCLCRRPCELCAGAAAAARRPRQHLSGEGRHSDRARRPPGRRVRKVPIIDDTRLFGLIRLGNRFRCSGSVEFTGWDATPSPTRAQAIVDNVIGVFPEFAKCYDRRIPRRSGRACGRCRRRGIPIVGADTGQEPLSELRSWPSRLDACLWIIAPSCRCRIRAHARDRYDRTDAGDPRMTPPPS